MRRSLLGALALILAALFSTSFTPASDEQDAEAAKGKAQTRRYSVFHIENSTSDLTIRYRVRWGPNAEWGQEVVLQPGQWFNHQWTYDLAVAKSVPTPEIRYASGITRLRNWASYGLVAYVSQTEFKNGKRYSFAKKTDDRGEDYVELLKWTRAEEVAFDFCAKGSEQYKAGNNGPAIENFTKAIKAYPEHAEALNYRGLANTQVGEYDQAIADFTEAIRLKPRYHLPYNNRGYSWNNRQEYDKALKDFAAALQIDPNYVYSYNGRGEAFIGKKQYDLAIAECTKAIQLNPKYVVAYNTRGLAYFRKGDSTHALPDFSEALRLNPQFAAGFNNRGATYFLKADYDACIENCTKAIELNPKFGRAYWWRSRAFAAKGQDASANADYDRALSLDLTLPRTRESVISSSKYGPTEATIATQAIAALRSFKLGSTLTPQRLQELNNLPNIEPLEKPATKLPAEVAELIRIERLKHDALEQEMVAAADKVLTAAIQTPEQRKAAGIRLQWLFGPVTSPYKRENSVDDLGGLRLVGHLELPDGRQVNMIFPVTYQASKKIDESKGGLVLLWGGDNCRVEAQLFTTGEVRSDFAYQSFSIDSEKETRVMEPKYYLDEVKGTLINKYITSKALGTSCMDCHANGPNLKKEDLQLMKEANFQAMRGFKRFLDQAEHLGANRAEVRELKKQMTENPGSLIPLESYRKANEEYWVQHYVEFARRRELTRKQD